MMASPGRRTPAAGNSAPILSPSNNNYNTPGGTSRGLVPLSLVEGQSPLRGADPATPSTAGFVGSPPEPGNGFRSPSLSEIADDASVLEDSSKMKRKSILNIKPVASDPVTRNKHQHQRQHQRTSSNDFFNNPAHVSNGDVASPLPQTGRGTNSLAMSPSSHHSRSMSDMSGFSSDTRHSNENEMKPPQNRQLIDPDVLVALAAKERHVLELREELQQAEADLDVFRNELAGSIVRHHRQAALKSGGLQSHSRLEENKSESSSRDKRAEDTIHPSSFPKLFDSAGESNKITTDEVVQIGKKFAEGINSQLWTIYKDIRQAARGEDQSGFDQANSKTELDDLSPSSKRVGANGRRRSPSPLQVLQRSLSRAKGTSPPPSPPIRSMASFLNLQNSGGDSEDSNNKHNSLRYGTRRKTIRMRSENTPDLAPPLILDNDKDD